MKLVKNPDEHLQSPPKVTRLPVVTSLEIDPDMMLTEAMGKLDAVIILGYNRTEEGEEYFATSMADGGSNVWLMQRAIHKLMQIVDE